MTLTCNVNNVKAAAAGAKLELTLKGGSFAESFSSKDIKLAKAFSKMKVSKVVASGNKLSLELKGKPTKNKQINAMEWGTVVVKSSGIADGYTDVTAAVDVEKEYSGIDAESLKYAKGKVTADIYSYGGKDITSLTAEDIAIKGVKTESVKKKEDHTVTVTFSAKGVKSASDFAALVNGKTLKLGDLTRTAYLPAAGFQPFFEYCEEDGKNLKLTINLLASGGTFAKKITKDTVTLSGDFEKAKIVSIKRQDDTTAKLIISVPANGSTIENFNYLATVTLAKGSLITKWGEATTAETTYTREYSGETLGRDDNITLNKETLLEIQKYTRGRDTAFGEILYWGNNIYQVYSFGKAVLECLGVVKSEHQQIMEAFEAVNAKLDNITDMLKDQALRFEDLDKKIYVQDLQPYFQDMNRMMNAYEGMRALYKNAVDDARDKHGVTIDFATASEKEITKYNDLLTDIIETGSRDPGNMRYTSYSANFNDLYTYFKAVAKDFIRDDPNPLPDPNNVYDQFCALEYNFDSQSYYPRKIFREYAVANMEKVMALFHIHYKTSSDPKNHDFILLDNMFRSAVGKIDKNPPSGHAPEEIKAHKHYKTTYDKTFVSDVKVIGADKKEEAQKLKEKVKGEGYTVIDIDLNEKADGHYVYICYKTTKDYKKAIKDITIREGKGKNSDMVVGNGRAFYLADFEGDAKFTKNKGDLNESSGGEYLYLYYTKELAPAEDPAYGKQKTAVGRLVVNKLKSGPNLNENGNYYWLHAEKCGEEGFPIIDTNAYDNDDPEYYPYCYTLGKKVCIWDSVYIEKYSVEFVDNKVAYNFSDDSLKAFTKRMKASTMSEELASAGMPLDYPFVVKLNKKEVDEKIGGAYIRTRDDCKGNLFLLGSKEMTKDVKLGKIYTYYHPKYIMNDSERYQEFCVMQLV